MILKFVALDFRTIKPYLTLKNLLIVLGIAFFMAYANKNALIPLSIVSVMVTIYLSYPFAVGEQNGIDPLYWILGLSRKEVVFGRYLWAYSMNLVGFLFGFVLSVLLSLVLNLPFSPEDALSMLLGLFFVFSIMQAFQFPLFFKMGYMKAKTISYIPFMVLGGGFVLFSSMIDKIPADFFVTLERLFTESLGTILLAGGMLWFLIQFISIFLSLRGYEKRSF